MNKRLLSATLLAGITLGCFAAAPEKANLKDLKGAIKVDGSSTVYPITEAVAEEFSKLAKDVRVTVGISGTGGGFKRFCVGEIDISDASRPITKKEVDEATKNGIEFIELPVAYDGLSIVVNKENSFVDQLTVDEIKKIYLDSIKAKTWADVRAGWPASPIKVYAPGTDSGTFDYFKEVVAGKDGQIRGDMSVSEDDNVLVKGVIGDPNAIGFFGCAYYFENRDKLRAVPIVNPESKKAVMPEVKTVEDGSYAPFSRPLFIYVNKTSAARPEIKSFVEFYLQHAPELVSEVGYVKLPASVYTAAGKNFAAMKTGTQFLDSKGEKIHGPVTSVYR